MSYAHHDHWVGQYESVVFTHEALSIHGDDKALAGIKARLAPVLGDWEAIENDRRKLRRAVLAADARVRGADAAMDQAIAQFAGKVLAETKGDAQHALYKKLFPEHHEDIIDLGLDAEIPLVTVIVTVLDKDESIAAELRSHREALRNTLKAGNSALADRSDVLADLGRQAARVEAWKETASATHRSVYRALGRLATERKLPARWLHAFFTNLPHGV